jgi:hypothetical protein
MRNNWLRLVLIAGCAIGSLHLAAAQVAADRVPDPRGPRGQAVSPYAHWVIWSVAEDCTVSDADQTERNAYIRAMRYNCRESWNEGLRMRFISGPAFSGPKLGLLFEISEDGKYLDAMIGLFNEGDKQIEINPSNFWAEEIAPKYKRLDIIPPEKIAASIMKGVRWRNAFTSFGAAFASQTATATTSSGDTISITMPDTAAQQRAAEENKANLDAASSDSASIIRTAIKRHTLLPHSQIARYLYFPNAKHFDVLLVHLPIDDVDYIFMVTASPERATK